MQNNNKLYGAILGDLCGQPFEFAKLTGYNKPITLHNEDSKFTDDTVMTCATAFALLKNISFEEAFKFFGQNYITAGYGKNFTNWLTSRNGTIENSWGNGCIMRLSPVIWAFKDTKIMRIANIGACTLNSHNTKESIESCLKLDQLYLPEEWSGVENKEPIKPQPFKKFEVAAVPTIAFVEQCFYHTNSTQEAILKAVECGGDTDTNASIVGELSNFRRNDITKEDIDYIESKIDSKLFEVLYMFNKKYK